MYNAPRASVLWFLPILMLSAYMWGYFLPTCIRRSNVSVPTGLGRYIDPCQNRDTSPHRIRSISSEQKARHANWIIAGPRRKPRTLLRVHTRPPRSLFDHIYPGSFTQIFNLEGTIPLVGSPDPHSKGPPRRLLPPHWIQLSGRIFWFTKSIAS